jgi:CRP-like cAMP-binding protein
MDRSEARRLVENHMNRWPEGSLLAGLGTRTAASLLACGQERWYRPRETLMRQGDVGRDLFLLLDGVVKAFTAGGTPLDPVLHAVRSSGDTVGEFAFIDGGERTATVVVARRDAVLIRVPYARLEALIAADPDLLRQVVTSMMDKHRAQMRHRDWIQSCDPPVRVARALVELIERHGEHTGPSWVLDIALSQKELGSYVNVGRNVANRTLGKLHKEGILDTKRQKVTLFDMKALRRYARL